MEKRLTKEELEKIEKQCFSLTDTLFQYELGMKGKDFKSWPPEKRLQIKRQFEFFKFSLNEGIKTLIMHGQLSQELSDHAAGNKFVELKTKFEILKFNKRKKILKDDND